MDTESPQIKPKPVCVVVDTSVWRAEPLLKTPMGATLVYMVRRQGGVFGLPEVVELELKAQIVEAGREAAEKARGLLSILGVLTDDPLLGVEFPSRETLVRMVDVRLAELAPVLIREPFTLEQAKGAMAMVVTKVPPNSEGNQQFKDSAIWQAVLALSLRYSTVLLTKDNSFFRDRDPAKGLAANLLRDCVEVGTSVEGYFGIRSYLKALDDDAPKFDRECVRQLLISLATPPLTFEAGRHGVVLTDISECNIWAFRTETPERFAIDYTLVFKVAPASRERPGHAFVESPAVIEGSGYFLPKTNDLTDHYVQRIAFKTSSSELVLCFEDDDVTAKLTRPLPWGRYGYG